MTKQRRSFSAEFKREAAGLVLDQGYSHIKAYCSAAGYVSERAACPIYPISIVFIRGSGLAFLRCIRLSL